MRESSSITYGPSSSLQTFSEPVFVFGVAKYAYACASMALGQESRSFRPGGILLESPQRFHIGIERIPLGDRGQFNAIHAVGLREPVRNSVQYVPETRVGGLIGRKGSMYLFP